MRRAARFSPLLGLLVLSATAHGDEVITWAEESSTVAGALVPAGRAAFAATLQAGTGPLDSQLWVFGGMLDGSTFSRELWRFSVLIGTWAQELAAGPAAAHGSRMVAVGRKLYVYGGAPSLDALVWVFNTLARTWSSIASI